jgi:Fe-S-cluster containining protein
MDRTRERERVLGELRKLHREVESEFDRLAAVHRERMRCGRGCASCCVDDLTVFEIEAARIVEERPDVLESAEPHEPGACAFLGPQGECRVYAQRPYVCRTQGLALRWVEPTETGGWAEMRDICPLNDEVGPPLESLDEADCWTVGPAEGKLADLQSRWGESGRRVRLRSLFKRP